MAELCTEAENKAKQAESLKAFSGLNLLHVKRAVEEILDRINTGGFFTEYTIHNIKHVNEMLGILEWLIPEKTKSHMSPADWLITVLSIYFHDMGLLITKDEFEKRHNTGFEDFVRETLYAGDDGEDYKNKLNELYSKDIEREKFLYQEFVRFNHAKRVKQWVKGEENSYYGEAGQAISTLNDLLGNFGDVFRKDLGKVCESHHKNDLSNTSKYEVCKPYGNDEKEEANLQYAAVLLRASDLLHITTDRAPSITFGIINPTNPVSQREWIKQNKVRRVRPKKKRDEEGSIDHGSQPDTIEVHANFKQSEGFFGLTEYLEYVNHELKECNNIIDNTREVNEAPHWFPWQTIDDSNIKTENFIPKSFKFKLDQKKILDLLTGHTLYNDTGVVLREVTQNALDATRLEERKRSHGGYNGEINIYWNSDKRVLIIRDNGTGMTQNIIEDNFLSVGASRYQDKDFKDEYPDFSAISRFGIGVLSYFMVADEVEVLTVHEDEDKARHLTLKSVHGKYLIQLKDKSDAEVEKIAPHGTEVRMRIRASADDVEILNNIKRWIVFPHCTVNVSIDGNDCEIGYDSPKYALYDTLDVMGFLDEQGNVPDDVRVVQEEKGSVQLAYAIRWRKYIREWRFVTFSRKSIPEGKVNIPEFLLGTCVEGVRVETGTPGFSGHKFVAVANSTGEEAPKTNVARSSLESTPERDQLLDDVYSIYADHVRREIEEIHEGRGFSLTWAAHGAQSLMKPLLDVDPSFGNHEKLMKELEKLPVLLVDSGPKRRAVSPHDVAQESEFWTTDSKFLQSAEELIKQAPGQVSLSNVIESIDEDATGLPDGIVLSSFSRKSELGKSVFEDREVSKVCVYKGQRRVDLKWKYVSDDNRAWSEVPGEVGETIMSMARHHRSFSPSSFARLYVANTDINTEGLDDEVVVKSGGQIFILNTSDLSDYLKDWFEKARNSHDKPTILCSAGVVYVVSGVLQHAPNVQFSEDRVRDELIKVGAGVKEMVDVDRLTAILEKTIEKVFDPSAWDKNRMQEDGDMRL